MASDVSARWAEELLERLRELPPLSMTVLAMQYFARMTESEVSTRTGLTVAQVHSASGKGLVELGRRLQKG